MKFTTRTRTETRDKTIDGITVPIQVKVTERVPLMPRDWDDLTTKAVTGLVGALTLIAIVWSTISIGLLLGGGVGFLAALIFDISWAVCLLLEWKARFDTRKRTFPRIGGWLLLGLTMFFIGWHGWVLDNIPLAIVGASVSLVAKLLWIGIMSYIEKPMSDEDRAWAEAVISQANARLATSQVQRLVALEEAKAVGIKLALEAERAGIIGVEQVPDMSGHQPDTRPEVPVNGSGQLGHSGSGSVLTGSDVLRTLSAEQVDEIKAAPSTAAFVRTVSDAGVRTLDDIMEIVRGLGLSHKESTIDRNLRGREAKKP